MEQVREVERSHSWCGGCGYQACFLQDIILTEERVITVLLTVLVSHGLLEYMEDMMKYNGYIYLGFILSRKSS